EALGGALEALATLAGAGLVQRRDDVLVVPGALRAAVRRILPLSPDARERLAVWSIDRAHTRPSDALLDLAKALGDVALSAEARVRAGIAMVQASRQRDELFLRLSDVRTLLGLAADLGDRGLAAEATLAGCSVGLRLGTATEVELQGAVREAREHRPDLLGWALSHLATFLRLRGDDRRALDVLAQAADHADARLRVVLASETSLARRALGDWQGALEAQEEALRLGGPTPHLQYRLGTLLNLMGHPEAARVRLDAALLAARAASRWHLARLVRASLAHVDQEEGDLEGAAVVLEELSDPSLTPYQRCIAGMLGCLLHVERGDLAAASTAAADALVLAGEPRHPGWIPARLADGVWRLYAHDPLAEVALEEVAAGGVDPFRLFALGFLGRTGGLSGGARSFDAFLRVARGGRSEPAAGMMGRLLVGWRDATAG
ncbi:MAG: hypothetical protein KC656_31010, partial [Myxococcales bacterium]|nr:hypothetical protein [Myxococcales bacterium]